ncbi:uncharacterized [Tachysurus ichikawai]
MVRFTMDGALHHGWCASLWIVRFTMDSALLCDVIAGDSNSKQLEDEKSYRRRRLASSSVAFQVKFCDTLWL